jgi:hypothetical protein
MTELLIGVSCFICGGCFGVLLAAIVIGAAATIWTYAYACQAVIEGVCG